MSRPARRRAIGLVRGRLGTSWRPTRPEPTGTRLSDTSPRRWGSSVALRVLPTALAGRGRTRLSRCGSRHDAAVKASSPPLSNADKIAPAATHTGRCRRSRRRAFAAAVDDIVRAQGIGAVRSAADFDRAPPRSGRIPRHGCSRSSARSRRCSTSRAGRAAAQAMASPALSATVADAWPQLAPSSGRASSPRSEPSICATCRATSARSPRRLAKAAADPGGSAAHDRGRPRRERLCRLSLPPDLARPATTSATSRG